jgi:2-polyprenyl-6-methoxyphenol hydroxylase-like FAD-dependent oxidoreductase
MEQPQILIAGAGPTGLVLALWLTKSGIPVRLFDKTDAPGTTSRALVLHARNMEFYRQLGIDQVVEDHAIQFKSGHLWLGGREVGTISFSNLGTVVGPHPYAFIIPQDLHEEVLVEQLKGLGVEVERGTELLGFAQDGSGVTARIRPKSGAEETFRCAYLAGCDGASSVVREQLRVGFPGGTYHDVYYVADIEGTGPVFNGDINLALDDADFLAIFPMKGQGRARLVGALHRKPDDHSQIRWEDVSQRMMEHLKLAVDKVHWFSTYRVHHRVAAHFQKGRAFLLGDAGHIHSPVGGQGMNTGIGDAVNLAWKLAGVLKGVSPASLLDTYEPERIAFARRLVASTDRAFMFVNARGSLATFVRTQIVPHLLPMLFRCAAVRRMAFRTVSQIAIHYPQSALSQGPSCTHQGGERLPWVPFKDAAGTDSDNFLCLKTLQWQVHCYGEAKPALRQLCDTRGLALHIFPWNTAACEGGLSKNAAYVVRPDGYIALVDCDADPSRIAAYLDRWLAKPL